MPFDPRAETARYINSLGQQTLEQTREYTINGHWLILGGLIVSFLVALIIVRSGIIDSLGTRLAHRSRVFRTLAVCAGYLIASSVLSLPWTIVSGWAFESFYGRTSQPLADFLAQDIIGTGGLIAVGSVFFCLIYSLIHRTGKSWWLWSGGLATTSLLAFFVLSPVVIEPVFNDYRPLPQGPVRTALTQMAEDAGIPQDRLFVYDGSRQSNKFTANVSGVLGTGRIAISDVALGQASLDEVRAVTGHEIGHYVLGHLWHIVPVLSLVAFAGFFAVDRLFPWFAALFGSPARVDMPEGLPVLIFMFGLFSVLAQPLVLAVSRQSERQADNYALCTTGLPDALAQALIKTAEYRYPRPSPLQEDLFYTHPSVEWRVQNAMEWKAGRWRCHGARRAGKAG